MINLFHTHSETWLSSPPTPSKVPLKESSFRRVTELPWEESPSWHPVWRQRTRPSPKRSIISSTSSPVSRWHPCRFFFPFFLRGKNFQLNNFQNGQYLMQYVIKKWYRAGWVLKVSPLILSYLLFTFALAFSFAYGLCIVMFILFNHPCFSCFGVQECLRCFIWERPIALPTFTPQSLEAFPSFPPLRRGRLSGSDVLHHRLHPRLLLARCRHLPHRYHCRQRTRRWGSGRSGRKAWGRFTNRRTERERPQLYGVRFWLTDGYVVLSLVGLFDVIISSSVVSSS